MLYDGHASIGKACNVKFRVPTVDKVSIQNWTVVDSRQAGVIPTVSRERDVGGVLSVKSSSHSRLLA